MKEYAIKNKIKITEFLPNYKRFGRSAPLKRNLEIIEYADKVLVFWDGKSKGGKYIIENCKKKNKDMEIINIFLSGK